MDQRMLASNSLVLLIVLNERRAGASLLVACSRAYNHLRKMREWEQISRFDTERQCIYLDKLAGRG